MNNLDKSSFILQLYSLLIIMQDFNNSDLMGELQAQNEKYLKQILKNQEEILILLKEV
jgi:hypothetical protein